MMGNKEGPPEGNVHYLTPQDRYRHCAQRPLELHVHERLFLRYKEQDYIDLAQVSRIWIAQDEELCFQLGPHVVKWHIAGLGKSALLWVVQQWHASQGTLPWPVESDPK